MIKVTDNKEVKETVLAGLKGIKRSMVRSIVHAL